jgi:hypothetical protein
VKSEREREKMASSPKMPRLDKEPVCTIDSSSESENEEELPDLDDYSEPDIFLRLHLGDE